MFEMIKLDSIPKEVKEVVDNRDFIAIYECNGMFDSSKKDYLISFDEKEINDEIECFGYVYNGTEPSFSEYGSFGLNKQRTERIW